ncbi:MAG: DUF1207 domain-containing protein [Nitrospira sp.]|jgi:hypothetical protein|nr:DUF1207 domain-containing protein [Nitrospira sp. BO4]
MGRRVSVERWIIGIVVIVCLLAGQAYADDSNEKKPNDSTPKEVLDCRYQQPPELSEGEATSEMFPSDDLFRPLLADPKQPQFFALWQSMQSRNERTNANIGSVGIGENFGFYTRRNGCNGWQISLLTGIFAQFDLDTSNSALINVDFNVGIPLTWRHGNWSARLRFYHQSSHIGDEFLGAHPGFQSIGLQFEEVDMIVSYDVQKWLRLYGGGAVMVNRQPSQIDRNTVQWGFEARTPTPVGRSYLFGLFSNPIRFSPVLTADFKSVEEQAWYINTNLLMGFDMSRAGSFKRLRILFNYYHGYNPYGQFFYSQKTESFGAGAYFMF